MQPSLTTQQLPSLPWLGPWQASIVVTLLEAWLPFPSCQRLRGPTAMIITVQC